MKTAITWPTVVVVLGMQAVLLAAYKMGIISGPGILLSTMTTMVGALMKPMMADKLTGGASIVPPTFDVPPVVIPPSDDTKSVPSGFVDIRGPK